MAAAVADKISSVKLVFQAAGDDGKLFGSVTNQDIHRQLEERGFSIERRRILLDDPIKSLGSHDVVIHLGPDTKATVKVDVSALTE
jgi:large subunit ribosomal protein L9